MRLRRRNSRLSSEVQTSSMNDIMFFLLLFFLIVSTMVNPSVIKVILPSAKGEQVVNKKTINLTITADKQYYIESAGVTGDDLKNALETEKNKFPGAEISVMIRGDISIQYADLVTAISACKQLNLPIALAVDEK